MNLQMRSLLSAREGDKLDVRIGIGKDGNVNMKPGEILEIITRVTSQAPDYSPEISAVKYGLSIGTQVAASLARWFGH